MPELPEVETIRRDLLKSVKGLKIESVLIYDSRVVRGLSASDFEQQLVQQKIIDILRFGKALLFNLGEKWLSVQPMMTGQLIHQHQRKFTRNTWTRVVLQLSKQNVLLYNDQRLFGRLTVVKTPEELDYVKTLGPDPLDKAFTEDVFRRLMRRRKMAVKVALMDRKIVAGIGNIYASEALFRAGLDPRRRTDKINKRGYHRLHKGVVGVLKDAIALRGSSMRNYRDGKGREGKFMKFVGVYGREGQPCRACSTPIEQITQAQRSTFYCPRCQQ